MRIDDLSVAYQGQEMRAQAEALAKRLGLGIDNGLENQLLVTAQGLWLKGHDLRPLQVNFGWQTWQKRRAQGKNQDLIKACKLKPGMTVIDTTAGWGRDAALFASFSATVTMLERHPVMQALLQDGLNRQTERDRRHLNLSLVTLDAKQYIQQLTTPVDVVYIDPMHPARQKSALVKKDMQLLQALIGPDDDALTLIEKALQCPCSKVVVKWPVRQPPLIKPTLSWSGKTVRYDCYKV